MVRWRASPVSRPACCEREAPRRASPGSGLLGQARQEPVGLMREAGCPDLGHEECRLFQSRIFGKKDRVESLEAGERK